MVEFLYRNMCLIFLGAFNMWLKSYGHFYYTNWPQMDRHTDGQTDSHSDYSADPRVVQDKSADPRVMQYSADP